MVSDADIVVAAVGRPELIKGSWIKPGAVVIDAGYNPGNIGGVEYTAAAHRARLITPCPAAKGQRQSGSSWPKPSGLQSPLTSSSKARPPRLSMMVSMAGVSGVVRVRPFVRHG